MIRRIDRYVSRALVVRFVGANIVILGLYISFDAVKRLDQVQAGAVGEALSKIGTFYLYQVPLLMLDIAPVLFLLAAALVLVQMARNGELLVLKASGLSLHRALLPIFVIALLLASLAFWARENILPECHRRYQMLNQEFQASVAERFFVADPEQGFKMFVGSYDFGKQAAGQPCMSQVTVMKFHTTNVPKMVLEADTGTWGKGGGILLETVTIQQFDEKGAAQDPVAFPTKLLETSLTPYSFVRDQGDTLATRLPAMTLSELNERAIENPNVPQFSVMIQARLAGILTPFLLLMIGLPLLVGLEHPTQSRVLGAVICVLVAAAFHVLSFVCISMGTTQVIGPTAAAWLPAAIAGPPGLWFYSHMRT